MNPFPPKPPVPSLWQSIGDDARRCPPINGIEQLDAPGGPELGTRAPVETRDGRLGWVAGDYLAVAPGLGFAIGDAVRVANGRQNLRVAPGLDADVRRVMWNNEVLLVREGPVAANGYTWYRVWNYGGEGWAAGEFLQFEPDGFPEEGGGG